MRTAEVREYFKKELEKENFAIDKTGQKTIEMIGASFIADEPAIFGEPNQDYVDAELKWYSSMSTNIHDIWGKDKEPPKAWQYSADPNGEINSNYGYLIFSNKYRFQYNKALQELLNNRDSRRAIMIYNRPEMWVEYDEGGKNDFVCTNAVAYYVRDGKMHCVVQMRSNDVVFGYKNDWAWQKKVLEMITQDYNAAAPYKKVFEDPLEEGNIYWQVQNLHVYERHFHLVE